MSAYVVVLFVSSGLRVRRSMGGTTEVPLWKKLQEEYAL
jgi:hypothetical protein